MATIAWILIVGLPLSLCTVAFVAAWRARKSAKETEKEIQVYVDQQCGYLVNVWDACRDSFRDAMSIDEWETEGMFWTDELYCGQKPRC